MKLLLENWREYVKQEVESFLPHGTIRDINMIGSSTLSPEEQDRQDMEKYGHIQAERDIDIEVKIADITREEAEEWAFSNEAERLEIENNYDVQLTIVENWRKFLTEQEEGEGVLLYHATCSPPESFASGIDAKRAKGFGQGEGFYFHRDKARALQHGKEALAGELDKEESCPEGAPTAYIVVSDEPVTPETFDIDYEAYAGGFAEFVINNREYFESRKEDYGIYRITPRIMQFFTETGGRKAVAPGRPIDRHRAVIISQMAEKLSSEDSEMFKRFEQEILPKATAIKYNGEEVIYPLRIEDLEGNVVWSR